MKNVFAILVVLIFLKMGYAQNIRGASDTAAIRKVLNSFRTETPGTRHVVHFNDAGASLPPDVVIETVTNYFKDEALFGAYETARKYTDQIGHVYELIAKLIGADKDEVAIFENAGKHGAPLSKDCSSNPVMRSLPVNWNTSLTSLT